MKPVKCFICLFISDGAQFQTASNILENFISVSSKLLLYIKLKKNVFWFFKKTFHCKRMFPIEFPNAQKKKWATRLNRKAASN